MNDLKTIVMVFRGPFQSYGTNSHFEIRHSDCYPSQSAILGIVAAAMGVHREEVNQIHELKSLKVAIRIDQIGHIASDYHIAAKYKSNGDFDRNYVTKRYYLEDAVFVVALEGENELVSKIHDYLRYPYFQLFYGRRSCPVNYDFLVGIYEESAIEQLHQQPWMAAKWYQKRIKQEKVRLDIYADQECLPKGKRKQLRRDRPVSFLQLGRKHEYRFEVHENIYVNNMYFKRPAIQITNHDAFAALGEE